MIIIKILIFIAITYISRINSSYNGLLFIFYTHLSRNKYLNHQNPHRYSPEGNIP